MRIKQSKSNDDELKRKIDQGFDALSKTLRSKESETPQTLHNLISHLPREIKERQIREQNEEIVKFEKGMHGLYKYVGNNYTQKILVNDSIREDIA